jgi:hypothetical protein
VYTVDKELIDFTVFRFYIDVANTEDRPEWNKSYSFREYYKTDNMFIEIYNEIIEKTKVNIVLNNRLIVTY